MARILLFTYYDRICLGNRILSSTLKQQGHECRLLFFKRDYNGPLTKEPEDSVCYLSLYNGNMSGAHYDISPVTPKEVELFISEIKDYDPDVIGLSTRSFWLSMSQKIVPMIKQSLPNAVTIAGGYGPTLQPEAFLEVFDLVCIGEGIEPLSRLARAVDTGSDFRSIPNLAYRQNGDVVRNPLLAPIRDTSEIPFPDWSLEKTKLIDEDRVIHGNDIYETSVYDIFSCWGCPGTCSYCMVSLWAMIYKAHNWKWRRARLRPPDAVIAELRNAKDTLDLKRVRFMDSTFGFDPNHTRRLMALYRREIGLPFFALLSPQFFTPELIDVLVDSGLDETFLGIQSGDPTIRKRVYKRPVADQKIRGFAYYLTEKHVLFKYDLISWNPLEGIAELENGLDFLDTLPKGPDMLIFKLTPFAPNSTLGKMVEQEKPEPLPDKTYMAYSLAADLIVRSEQSAERIRAMRKTVGDLTEEIAELQLLNREMGLRTAIGPG